MSDTVFTNNVTLTDADWFNDVNRLHYTIFADPSSLGAAQLVFLASPGTIGGTLAGAGNFKDLSASAIAGAIIATQAQMEAGTAANKVVTPAVQHQHKSAAKAWGKVTFSGGTPTLQDGYNATVNDTASGVTTISLSASMSSSAYCAIATVLVNGAQLNYIVTDAFKPGSFVVRGYADASASASDVNFCFVVFGDLL